MILAGVELIMWRTLCFVPHQLEFSYESQLISGPLMLQANHQREGPVYASESGDPTRPATMNGRNGCSAGSSNWSWWGILQRH